MTPDEYHRLISKLKIKKVSSSSLDFMQHMNLLRNDIDQIDSQILQLLAQRMEKAKKIAFQKMKNNISIFQPERWEEVIKTRIKQGLEQNLAEDFISKLYQFIHEESIRTQEQVLSD